MKTKILLLLIMVASPFLTGFFWDSNYLKAEKLYEDEKYEDAYKIYSDIVSKESDPLIKQSIHYTLYEMLISGKGVTRDANKAIYNLEKVIGGLMKVLYVQQNQNWLKYILRGNTYHKT